MSSSGPEAPDASAAPLAVERRGAALIVAIDRPAVRNALNFACWEQLDATLRAAEADPEVRALVITGSATVFSAGGDMKAAEPRGTGLMAAAARLECLQGVLSHLASLAVPSIAAVEGPAVGVAWGLALTCDFVVAGEGATFIAAFPERRLVPDGGLAWQLVRAVGRLRATDILFLHGRLSAAEARSLGLVTEVTPQGGALARALEIAKTVAATSPDTTRLSLRALRRAEQVGHRDYLATELELAALNLQNPEIAGARLSFRKDKSA